MIILKMMAIWIRIDECNVVTNVDSGVVGCWLLVDVVADIVFYLVCC